MNDKILNLIGEQTSPLFRIMSTSNVNEPNRRAFDNNISAFHIGNGFFLSAAHNIRSDANLFRSMQEARFQKEVIAKCNQDEVLIMNRCYILDPRSNKRYLNIGDQKDVPLLIAALRRINYDTRWISLYSEDICKPYLIVNFKNSLFYNDVAVTQLFSSHHMFQETNINTYTFLIELELVEAFYSEDFALYRIVNTDQQVIDKIPTANISFDLSGLNQSLYCLQGSPSGTNLGRMVNEFRIEGIIDHHAVEIDRIGGNIIRGGTRYLLKGYFRFGSSGAPYFAYNKENDKFLVNAVQSEASPIQLSIANNREGNFQYVNAIASPLLIIKGELEKYIN